MEQTTKQFVDRVFEEIGKVYCKNGCGTELVPPRKAWDKGLCRKCYGEAKNSAVSAQTSPPIKKDPPNCPKCGGVLRWAELKWSVDGVAQTKPTWSCTACAEFIEGISA